ncbi:MAG: 50S ribosomal protein L25/general stress protein Ctc [Epsilonproteobacteria bacterium]|nr:50S ribosomal protein L25/general stress protein Ctc [Campylobacterota bacterium]
MLEGIIRESTSKAATKALRRDGYLIANIYGKNIPNVNAAFKTGDFIKYLKQKEHLIFPVKVGDKEFKVVVQEYQKDPVKGNLLHVDLLVAQDGVKQYFYVPIKVVGTPKGLKNKGVLIYHRRRIKVKSIPENLPDYFELDVSDLDVGDNILIRDINMPEGVECYLDPSIPVVGVIKAK